jgi:hypothetical protein
LPHLAEWTSLGTGHIYVLGFEDGQIKVGRSQQPRVRIRTLRAKARREGGLLVEGWFSEEHANWRLTEIRMIAFCLETFGDPIHGIETFAGDYVAVLAYAQSLTRTAIAA